MIDSNPGTHLRRLRDLVADKLTLSDSVLLSVLLILAALSFWPDRKIAGNCLQSDAPDYVLPALNFLKGNGFVLMVGGHKYPPEHLFGLPLLMSPAYALAGPYVGNGIYSIFVLGLGVIVFTYWLARRLFDRRIAFAACLFLMLADDFRWHLRYIAPDSVSALFYLGAHLLLLAILYQTEASPWVWIALGQIIGLGMLVRPDNILVCLPVTVCLFLAGRKINWSGVGLAVGGIALWCGVILLANQLYVGDWRRMYIVAMDSGARDRVGGLVSWRYLLQPTFKESNLHRLLVGFTRQYSYCEGSGNVRWYGYTAFNAFLILGLVKLAAQYKKGHRNSHFLIWVLVCIPTLLLAAACLFEYTTGRVMLRVVPYLCILDGIGLVTLWDLAGKWRTPLDPILDRVRTRIHVRLRPCIALLQFRALLGGLMAVWAGYVFLHPLCDAEAWIPITAYLAHVNRLIPENDAVIISNCNPFYTEHFLVSDSARMLVPLHRLITGADFYVQWKKPPHPEWINEDFPDRSRQWLSVMYDRQRENGAQFIFPYTAEDNLDVIVEALRAGRKVYFVGQGIPTTGDLRALMHLRSRTDLRFIERGFEPSYQIPAQAREFLSHYYVLQVSAIDDVGTRLRLDADGRPLEILILPEISRQGTKLRITPNGQSRIE